MGRLVKKSERERRDAAAALSGGAKQGNLLGFLRKPLIPVLVEVNTSTSTSTEEASPDAQHTSAAPEVEATAVAEDTVDGLVDAHVAEDTEDEPGAPPRTSSQRLPSRMADSLVRIERNIGQWERLFAAHARTRVSERAEAAAAAAERTAAALVSLTAAAYEHRVHELGRARSARTPSAWWGPAESAKRNTSSFNIAFTPWRSPLLRHNETPDLPPGGDGMSGAMSCNSANRVDK
jgi:hypothetical protein